ncbi:MAG: TauD/TfdA family dioxygenase [Proteobacteria bacterium]|nr:TauD/TfdA family dioxygenase [Pseudomonadota bacterium]
MSETTTRTARQTAIPGRKVIDPATWSGAELERSGDWIHCLSEAEMEDIDQAVRGAESADLDIMDISRESFPLPVFGATLACIREQLLNGAGLALIRGFPVERYNRAQAAAAFFGIGCYLGRAVSQNAKGHVLGHVKKLTDSDYNVNPNERGYRTNVDQRFHADSCDVVGLMCLQTPKSGGLSSVVSTVTVHNEMLARRPDLVQVLAGPIYWDRRGEVPEGKDQWYVLPVFNYHGGWFSCRYARQYIDSTQRFEQVPRTTPAQLEALNMMDSLLAELHMKMQFQTGDIQFLFNHVTLHGRTAFEDWPEPERKRHLFRLWLTIDGERPLPAVLAERTQGGIVTGGTILNAPLEAE